MSSLQQLMTMPGIWFALTASIQLLAVSLLGFIAVKAVARRSAPLRSMVAMSAMTALALTLIGSAFFHFSHISWWTPPVPVPAVSAVRVAAEALSLPNFSPAEMKLMPEKKTSAQTPSARVIPAPGAVMSAVKSRFNFDYGQTVIFAGMIWLAGMAFMLGRLTYGLVFLRGFYFGLSPVRNTRFDVMLRNAAERFGQKKSPLMFTSPRVESPITVGIAKPVVIIPEKLLGNLSDDEMKSILMHELAHIYSRDHIAGVFKRIVIAANWWNPLVYMISNEHSAAREEVADSYALLELHPKVYSECLVGLAEKTCLINSFPATAGMAGKYSSLEQRVRNILSTKKEIIMKTGKGIRLAAVLICGVLALAVAGIQAASADEKAKPAENKAVEGKTLSISEKEIKTFLKILPKYKGNFKSDIEPIIESMRKESGFDNDLEFRSWMKKMVTGFAICYEEKSTLTGLNKAILNKITKDVKLTDESRILIEKYYPEVEKIVGDLLDKQLDTSSNEVKTLSISENEIKTFLKILPKYEGNPQPDIEALQKESGLKNDIDFHSWMEKMIAGFGICCEEKSTLIGMNKKYKDIKLTDESRILIEKYYPEFKKIGEDMLDKQLEASSNEVETLSISENEIKTFLKILPKFLSNPKDTEALRKESGMDDEIEFHLWMAKVMTGFGICSLNKKAPIMSNIITTIKNAKLTDESRTLLEKYYPEFEEIGKSFVLSGISKPVKKTAGPAKPVDP